MRVKGYDTGPVVPETPCGMQSRKYPLTGPLQVCRPLCEWPSTWGLRKGKGAGCQASGGRPRKDRCVAAPCPRRCHAWPWSSALRWGGGSMGPTCQRRSELDGPVQTGTWGGGRVGEETQEAPSGGRKRGTSATVSVAWARLGSWGTRDQPPPAAQRAVLVMPPQSTRWCCSPGNDSLPYPF